MRDWIDSIQARTQNQHDRLLHEAEYPYGFRHHPLALEAAVKAGSG